MICRIAPNAGTPLPADNGEPSQAIGIWSATSISANEGKLVAAGGIDNAHSIFSAKFLEVAGPWSAAAIEALAK
jgi:hypothetical protein